MNKITLPFWMDKGELKKLIDAAQSFWEKVETWLRIPLTQFDLMTCDIIIVDYIAWQRKIERLEGENETIYRKRIDFAYVNAQDAGMTRGIYNIFGRLGITIMDIKERQLGRDWDIVTLELDDQTLSDNKKLINLLIKTYGATCRRYEYNISTYLEQKTFHGDMAWTHKTQCVGFLKTVTNIEIKPASIDLIVGETLQLLTTVTYSNGQTNSAVTWKSSDKSIATVTDYGLVKAIKNGDITITATSIHDDTKSSTAIGSIMPPPDMKIIIDRTGTVPTYYIGYSTRYSIGEVLPASDNYKITNDHKGDANAVYLKAFSSIDGVSYSFSFGCDQEQKWLSAKDITITLYDKKDKTQATVEASWRNDLDRYIGMTPSGKLVDWINNHYEIEAYVFITPSY